MQNHSQKVYSAKKERGFTLIELMITVAIVGILAAIAYPSYQRQMLRTNRSEGLSALQDAAARQERYFSNNSEYTVDLGAANIAGTTVNGHYAISVAAGNCGDIENCYTVTADAQGGQVNDNFGTDCTTLTLDSTGARTPADCW
ncbi:MAG TPA: type IV pilin protein [Gammaproteobacteria bacterium]